MTELGLLTDKSKAKTLCTSALIHISLIDIQGKRYGLRLGAALATALPIWTSVGHREGYGQLRGHLAYERLPS